MFPDLYWISSSTPAWRVMLGFTLKGLSFTSQRLDHGLKENRRPGYLALNPKGQVPTVVTGELVIRESLAWLDCAFPDRPIWGETAADAALVSDRPSLHAWMNRFAALPGVEDTYPPHRRN